MTKFLRYIKDLNRFLEGGYTNGGGTVAELNYLKCLTEFDDVEFVVLTSKPFDGTFLNAQIIQVEDNPQKINDKIKEIRPDFVLSRVSRDFPHSFPLHCHSPFFSVNRSKGIIRFIKNLLYQKKYSEIRNEYSNFNPNTRILAGSDKMKTDYVTNMNLSSENIFVIRPGCKEIYKEMPEKQKNDFVTFGLVANSSFNKGGEFSLFAFAKLKKTGCKFKVKYVAKRPNKAFIPKFLISVLGLKDYIEIVPRYKNMEEFYKTIDCMLLPSMNEAFGLVVTEAMTYAIPSIVSDTTGVAEIIDNTNGITFERNTEDFAQKLKGFIDMYEKDFEGYVNMSKRAFETSKKFTWQNYAKNLYNLAKE